MLGYPFNPHSYYWRSHSGGSTYSVSSRSYDTRQELERDIRVAVSYEISAELKFLIDDVEQLAVLTAVQHATNPNTLALANARIPDSLTPDDTLRFLIAFLYEREAGEEAAVQFGLDNIYQDQNSKWRVREFTPFESIVRWLKRSDKIVELMKRFEANSLKDLAGVGYTDYVRNSALVELGETIGIQIQTSTTQAILGARGATGVTAYLPMPANFKLDVPQLQGIWNLSSSDPNTARPVTITGKNGASLIHTYSGANYISRVKNPDHLLAKDATFQLTHALMRHQITSTPIPIPTVATEQADLTIATGVTESVNLSSMFSGTRLTITAESHSPTIATVQVNSSQTSMGVVGVMAGTTPIKVSCSNESGSVSQTFTVTVT